MKRTAEKGQAYMEFVVCIIPLIFVFSGLILVAVLGRANVQNTINARSASDLGKSQGNAQPKNIVVWDYGKDSIPFTADDVPVTGENTYYVSDQMDTEKNTVSGKFSASFNLQDAFNAGYVGNMPGQNTFTHAADLVGTEVSAGDVLSKKKLTFFSRMFQIYLNSFHTNVKDTVFMPNTKDAKYNVTVD